VGQSEAKRHRRRDRSMAFSTSCLCRVRASDIYVSKINLVSVTVLRVTGFFRFYCILVLKYFSVSVSVVSFQIILISVSVLISVSGFIILINKSIILILELTMLHNNNLALAGISTSVVYSLFSHTVTPSLCSVSETRICRFLDSLFLQPAVSHPHWQASPPSPASQTYNLRPRGHAYSLPTVKSTSFMKGFINKALFNFK